MIPSQLVRVQTQASLTWQRLQKKRQKNEAIQADMKQKYDAILISRHVSLRQKALCETHHYGLGGRGDSGQGGKNK